MSQVCSPERLSATVSDRPTPNRQVATPRTPRRSQPSSQQPVSPVATEIDSDGSPSRSPRSRSRRLSQRHSPSTRPSQSRQHSPIPASKSGEDDLLLLLEVGEILSTKQLFLIAFKLVTCSFILRAQCLSACY